MDYKVKHEVPPSPTTISTFQGRRMLSRGTATDMHLYHLIDTSNVFRSIISIIPRGHINLNKC